MKHFILLVLIYVVTLQGAFSQKGIRRSSRVKEIIQNYNPAKNPFDGQRIGSKLTIEGKVRFDKTNSYCSGEIDYQSVVVEVYEKFIFEKVRVATDRLHGMPEYREGDYWLTSHNGRNIKNEYPQRKKVGEGRVKEDKSFKITFSGRSVPELNQNAPFEYFEQPLILEIVERDRNSGDLVLSTYNVTAVQTVYSLDFFGNGTRGCFASVLSDIINNYISSISFPSSDRERDIGTIPLGLWDIGG